LNFPAHFLAVKMDRLLRLWRFSAPIYTPAMPADITDLLSRQGVGPVLDAPICAVFAFSQSDTLPISAAGNRGAGMAVT